MSCITLYCSEESVCQCKRCRFNPWVRKVPSVAITTHSSILAWKIPWAEEPGGVESMGSQKVGHDLTTEHTCNTLHNVELFFVCLAFLSKDGNLCLYTKKKKFAHL